MGMQATSKGNMPVVLLKEGGTETKGRDAQKNNIAAAKIIAEIVHTSLGPRGMDKMLVLLFLKKLMFNTQQQKC